jgi:phage head maturation protease
VRALLERGDLTGEMSFGFFVEKDVWTGNKRSIQSARLTEISIVQDAAYPNTHSALRHVAEAEIALRQIALRRRTWM